MRKILALFALLIASPALAQTVPNQYFALKNIGPAGVSFIQGTDSPGTYKTIYTGASNGSVCFSLVANSNDQSTSHPLTLRYTVPPGTAAFQYDICTATVGNNALAANTFGPAVAILVSNNCPMAISQVGNTYMQLKSGETLQLTFSGTLTAADRINGVAQCADYQ